ncbi:MAG: hypothetical protein WEC39_00545 [Patescibacteria group bacterium]
MAQIISNEDLKILIAQAYVQGKQELLLRGSHFADINLRNERIPISLDFDDSIFDGDFILAGAEFGGRYISLDRALIKGIISLSGMKSSLDGFAFYLRGAYLKGPINLELTKITRLVVFACDFIEGVGMIRVEGTTIERIFTQPEQGELAEIKNLKREASKKRKSGEFSA